MLLIDMPRLTDVRLNLALEEHVLRHAATDEDLLLFYVNAPTIIVGRNQNTVEEIDPEFVAARDIRVVRRLSGGGAVYHDLGNLNFSFMTRDVRGHFNRYERFNQPVLDVLRDLGVPACLSGRNDIVAGSRKISGNAQYAAPDRMLSHGTLLLDSNLDDVGSALRPRPGKVESKGVKSVRRRVANISEFLKEPVTVDGLRKRILERIFGTCDEAAIPTLRLTEEDRRAARDLSISRYGSWAWNFGRSPPSSIRRTRRFSAGEIDVRIDLEKGRIAELRIFGDSMGRAEIAELERRLRGARYDRTDIVRTLEDVNVHDYFGDIRRDDVLDVLCG